MSESLSILVGGLGILGLWVTYHCVWMPALLTTYRQDLFTLRGQLFLDAAEGRLSFQDPGYGMLRVMIQGTIRASGSLTLTQLLLFWLFWKPRDRTQDGVVAKFLAHIEGMPDREQANLLAHHRDRLVRLTALHFCRMYWPIVGAVVLWILLKVKLKFIQRQVLQTIENADPAARRYVEAASETGPRFC